MYIHKQKIADDTWIANHNLNETPITEVLVDKDGGLHKIRPSNIRSIDTNNTEITFSIPMTGVATFIGPDYYAERTVVEQWNADVAPVLLDWELVQPTTTPDVYHFGYSADTPDPLWIDNQLILDTPQPDQPDYNAPSLQNFPFGWSMEEQTGGTHQFNFSYYNDNKWYNDK